MALSRLYPPTIAGTLPSFYLDEFRGTVFTVPFSMNKTVRASDIKGMSLRIKTTNTDIVLGVIQTARWDINSATFNIPANIAQKLLVGQFYKIQLAYIDTYGTVGYYSSIGVTKLTAKPSLSLADFSIQNTNINITKYIGVYKNPNDPTEKVYEYRFTLYDNKGNIIEDSGWLLHNSYTDENTMESTDSYIIKTALKENLLYKIQYWVRTNNNLQLASLKYPIMQTESLDPNIKATLNAKLDYDNACIHISLMGEKIRGEESRASGAFVLTRASSDTNFGIWTILKDFRFFNEYPSSFSFIDFTIEHGVTYRYAIQQYNDSNLYSNRIYAPDVTAYFEHIFLYDGTSQLKIQYNPKVASFKTTVLDAKKTTIGGQYPFIFRNGAVSYKEFPINGLISYLMDNDCFFLQGRYQTFLPSFNYTDDNIAQEKMFKIAVLDWLNDGNIKMFKSPTEGNYLVRLMNVSLTPVESTGRMIHSFTCQANEVASFNVDNLTSYHFLDQSSTAIQTINWQTTMFNDFVNEMIQKYEDTNIALQKMADTTLLETDLLRGEGCRHLKIVDVMPGSKFQIGNLNIVIGSTGSYEVQFETPQYGLYLLDASPNMGGSITYGIVATSNNKFDIYENVQIFDIPLYQTFGPQENILDNFTDIKHEIIRIHYARFSQIPVEHVSNRNVLDLGWDDWRAGRRDYLIENQIYYIAEEGNYYRFAPVDDNQDPFILMDEYSSEVQYGKQKFSVEQDNTVYFADLDYIPEQITIGNGVCCEIGLQIKKINYGVENRLSQNREKYEQAKENYHAYSMNYREARKTEINDLNIDCYIFNGEHFLLVDKEIDSLSGNERVWTINETIQPSAVINNAKNNYLKEEEAYFALLHQALIDEGFE